MSTCLLACAGPTRVHETVARPRIASSVSARKQRATPVRSSSTLSARPSSRKAAAESARNAKPEPSRDAKSSFAFDSDLQESSGAEAFAGVDTVAPKDEVVEKPAAAVDVEGIEGTMSEYDVRTTLQGRDPDFDHCHDQFRGGSGRLTFRIHIASSGDVGEVKVHRSKVRSSELVACYTEVVESTHFTPPHGGYADVKWTTKVGRSRRRPDATFERRVRWDTPAVGGRAQPEVEASGQSRRERRHARHHHHHHKDKDS